MNTAYQLHAGLMACRARAGGLEPEEVAKIAGLDPRTIKLTDGTTVGTLRKIAAALPYTVAGETRQCTIADVVREVGEPAEIDFRTPRSSQASPPTTPPSGSKRKAGDGVVS